MASLRTITEMPVIRHLIPALIIMSKVAAKGKSLLSMILAVAVYTWTWGLPFAVGLIAMLFIHEMGHVHVIRRYGIKASAPMFIPFVGAVINMEKVPQKAWDEAMIGFGGPLAGGLASFATMGLAMYFHSQVLQCIAYVGFTLNLFNMLPMRPLDGGRIIQAVSPWIHVLGCVAGLGLTFVISSPLLGIMTVLGIMEIYPLFKMGRQKDVPSWHRLAVGIAYLVTIAALLYGAEATFLPTHAIKTIQGQ
jgi:Zn-dependent protease